MMHFTNSRHPPKPLPIPLPNPASEPVYPTSTDDLLDPSGDLVYPHRSYTPDSTSNGLVRRKSILKMPKVTWDEPSDQPARANTPNPKKLQKQQPPKGVRFTPSTTGEGPYSGADAYPTPDPTPAKVKSSSSPSKGVKKKPSWIPWPFHSNSNSHADSSNHQHKLPTVNDTPSPTGSDCSWHHHSSYFLEYTPIYPPVTPAFVPPTMYNLSEAEKQAQEHAKKVGHSVVVHYPMLPSWAEYGGQADKAKNGWQTANNSLVNGWNGYGWTEDKLPKTGELTFGKPAPAGEPLEGAKKKKKKNKKKKGGASGGGGGGGDEGGDDDEEGGDGEGADEEGG
ncbi:uncharacterized protein I303_106067 [Kwoniella dejecticola CBS 10117]|uniref:Uncharacterized protein n=1 Tax=Kwoniella dejecticola CBS 10117 TaxID=1296121 RepID=A0A1A6A169_9TREE|nr:uncharacterized protein I303_06087 [Kwoniella dejecticola CBS 10117]OBR83804.1 hypothetical protein I303_06087 [Kwoniella dejecticola CBS 10117]